MQGCIPQEVEILMNVVGCSQFDIVGSMTVHGGADMEGMCEKCPPNCCFTSGHPQ